jgi:8-hydroxy-5-deazaflavin:NADPH oxidoreductase
MKIGIVGAGNIGSGIARLAVQQGHEVMLSDSRGPDTLAELVKSNRC